MKVTIGPKANFKPFNVTIRVDTREEEVALEALGWKHGRDVKGLDEKHLDAVDDLFDGFLPLDNAG